MQSLLAGRLKPGATAVYSKQAGAVAPDQRDVWIATLVPGQVDTVWEFGWKSPAQMQEGPLMLPPGGLSAACPVTVAATQNHKLVTSFVCSGFL